jgi:hypothetical protein
VAVVAGAITGAQGAEEVKQGTDGAGRTSARCIVDSDISRRADLHWHMAESAETPEWEASMMKKSVVTRLVLIGSSIAALLMAGGATRLWR